MNFFTSTCKKAAVAAALLLTATSLQAQDGLQGYVNAYARVKAVTTGAGKVFVQKPGATGLPSYKEVADFQDVLPVAMGICYFNAQAKAADGYTFVGWYMDINGNGELDLDTDELVATDIKTTLFMAAADMMENPDDEFYATEADARTAAVKPTSPRYTFFAFFSNGAFASTEYGQADCGNVSIDKPINSPGDVVTVTATPAEGYHFDYWKSHYGTTIETGQTDIVSTDAQYTFTVKGGEKLYACFSADDAPYIDFPAEGGWMCLPFDAVWILHEQSNAMAYIFTINDIVEQDGQVYLNSDNADALYDNTQIFRESSTTQRIATLIYGHGRVYMSHRSQLGYGRVNALEVHWSGAKTETIKDAGNANLYHVYAFDEVEQAFVEIGNTDYYVNPDAPTSVTVPSNTAYFYLPAYDLSDALGGTGDLPTRINLKPAAFNNGIKDGEAIWYTGINEVQSTQNKVPFADGTVYDLTGRRVQNPTRGSMYIVNGKKVFVK